MKWPWSKKKAEVEPEVDPWENSPFNADVIRPGDPGWALFQKALESDSPVMGVYNAETGEIVSIRVLDEEA